MPMHIIKTLDAKGSDPMSQSIMAVLGESTTMYNTSVGNIWFHVEVSIIKTLCKLQVKGGVKVSS